MKHSNHLRAGIAMPVLVASLLFACKREQINSEPKAYSPQVVESSATAINEAGNTAASHIAASEKLAIPSLVQLPANLPAGNSRVATYYAVGVQKYKAAIKPGSDPIVYQWVFVAPQAELYDGDNNKIGEHGAGPYWSLSPADSIFAQHFSPARTAASTDTESIDWLLLIPKSGTTPSGIFTDVDYIQRIATKGGKAPLAPPASLNETVEVKYKAVYRFSKINL
jgi:hypothetical protein